MSLTAEELEILRLSLRVAFWSVLVSLPFAIAVAYLLARASFPGKTLFDAVVHLPLVLPPVVVGYFLLLLFGRRGPLGGLLEDWFGSRGRVPLDRRCACGRHHGFPADGARDPAFVRDDRPQARSGGEHAGRRTGRQCLRP